MFPVFVVLFFWGRVGFGRSGPHSNLALPFGLFFGCVLFERATPTRTHTHKKQNNKIKKQRTFASFCLLSFYLSFLSSSVSLFFSLRLFFFLLAFFLAMFKARKTARKKKHTKNDVEHKLKPSKGMQIVSLKHSLENNAYFCRFRGRSM